MDKEGVLVTESCQTFCEPKDCCLPGSCVHGIIQARMEGSPFLSSGDLPNPGLEPRSSALQADSLLSEPPGTREWIKNCACMLCCSVMSNFLRPLWTVDHQAPLSMEFPRQEYWSGQLFPSPGALPNPGIEFRYPGWQADSLSSEPPGKPSG